MVYVTAFGALGLGSPAVNTGKIYMSLRDTGSLRSRETLRVSHDASRPGNIYIPLRGISSLRSRETLRVSHGASRHWHNMI